MSTEAKNATNTKADNLASKMNRITKKLSSNLNIADELELQGDDIVQFVEEKTQDIKLYKKCNVNSNVIDLNNLILDFKYVRETLKENTDNGRRVLGAVTLSLLDADDDKRASLITAFAELNKAVAENMKLYVTAYKDISNVLININKLKEIDDNGNVDENKQKSNIISTIDLIQSIKEK